MMKSQNSELLDEIKFLEHRLQIWVERISNNPDRITREISLRGVTAVTRSLKKLYKREKQAQERLN